MIRTPLTACSDGGEHWIEDANGETLLNVDPTIAASEAERIAKFTVHALTYLRTIQEHCRRVAPEHGKLGGRPRLYRRVLIEKPKQRGRPRRTKKPITGG